MGWLPSLMPPAPGAGPEEHLRWVRRVELHGGIFALGLAAVFWDEVVWRWLLIAAGVLSLSPWPGPQALLRKAERKPTVLLTDPQRRRARAKRVALILPPVYCDIVGGIGYVLDGWPAAIFMGALTGLGTSLACWWFLRREQA